MKISQKDVEYIQSNGIAVTEVQKQLSRFKEGFPDMQLTQPVSEGNGLLKLSPAALQANIEKYDLEGRKQDTVKFVPASGAASRMFKLLYHFLEEGTNGENADISTFYSSLPNFAFYEELKAHCPSEKTFENWKITKDKTLVQALLQKPGLNYGFLPKALLTFHKYENGTFRKAIDEHLVEGARYCKNENSAVYIHFTVSEEHLDFFKNHLSQVQPTFEEQFKVQYRISFSTQDKATDTIAVYPDNAPFRTADGHLLFRPGGHGALLQNLNALHADIVFIKNVDNVAAEWLLEDTVNYKKALAGVLLDMQAKIFDYCRLLKDKHSFTRELENEILTLLQDKCGCILHEAYANLNTLERSAYLFSMLHRPIRVCGVVEASNTGGGPFWVRHTDGTERLQLVETAQVNPNDTQQMKILSASRYANITDLVCGIKDFNGEKFDLLHFRDENAGFIAEKSVNGKTIKAMELPGLWNGAMSNWNTLFVQVPITTFNPVKTVMDLLKKEHQGTEKI